MNHSMSTNWKGEVLRVVWIAVSTLAIIAVACGQSQEDAAAGVEKLLDRGNDYMESHDYGKALETFNKVIEIDPLHTKARNNKAVLFLMLGQIDKSVEAYDEIISIDPADMRARYSKATALLFDDQFERAIDLIDETALIDPHQAEAFYQRALAYSRYPEHSNLPKALKELNRAIELNSEDFRYYSERGDLHFAMRNYDLAIADRTAAIDRNSNNYDSYIARAFAFIRLSQYTSAFHDIEVKLGPTALTSTNLFSASTVCL